MTTENILAELIQPMDDCTLYRDHKERAIKFIDSFLEMNAQQPAEKQLSETSVTYLRDKRDCEVELLKAVTDLIKIRRRLRDYFETREAIAKAEEGY